MSRRRVMAGLAAVLLHAPAAAAQELTEPERWAVTLDFGFNAASGNTQLVLLSSAFQIRHLITDEFRLEWSAQYRYGESEGDVVARDMRTTMTGDFLPHATLSPFFFATVERNPFRRLRVRGAGGGGAKYTLHRDRESEISISLAALYSRERFLPAPDGLTAPSTTDARWSMRVRGRHALTDRLRLEHTSFYQPVWDRLDDYHLDATTRLALKLNQRFTIGFLHNYRFDATPPPDVLSADQVVQVNLTFEF